MGSLPFPFSRAAKASSERNEDSLNVGGGLGGGLGEGLVGLSSAIVSTPHYLLHATWVGNRFMKLVAIGGTELN